MSSGVNDDDYGSSGQVDNTVLHIKLHSFPEIQNRNPAEIMS